MHVRARETFGGVVVLLTVRISKQLPVYMWLLRCSQTCSSCVKRCSERGEARRC